METKQNVRLMDKPDLGACSELMLKVFSGEPWFDQWDSVQHVQQYLGEFMDNPVFLGFVIEQDGKVLELVLVIRRAGIAVRNTISRSIISIPISRAAD